MTELKNPSNKLAPLLFVENSPDYALWFQRALVETQIPNRLHVLPTTNEARDYLDGLPPYADPLEYPLPALLLLNVAVPRLDGLELLKWVRRHPTLRNLRVLTVTEFPQHIDCAYEFGANVALLKPVNFDQFVQFSRFLRDHWLSTSLAPMLSRLPKTAQPRTTELAP